MFLENGGSVCAVVFLQIIYHQFKFFIVQEAGSFSHHPVYDVRPELPVSFHVNLIQPMAAFTPLLDQNQGGIGRVYIIGFNGVFFPTVCLIGRLFRRAAAGRPSANRKATIAVVKNALSSSVLPPLILIIILHIFFVFFLKSFSLDG